MGGGESKMAKEGKPTQKYNMFVGWSSLWATGLYPAASF